VKRSSQWLAKNASGQSETAHLFDREGAGEQAHDSAHLLSSGLYRRPWLLTRSADPAQWEQALAGSTREGHTAGGESHPAPKT